MARQFGALSAGRLGAASLSFVWLAIVVRFLSVPEFADFALVLSVGAMTSVVADGGLPLVLNEAVAADPRRARGSLATVISRRMMLAVLAVIAMAVLYLLAANNPSPAVPAIFAISIVATAWHTSCSAALRGVGLVVPEAVNEVMSRLFVLLVGTTLLVNGAGLVAIVATYATADAISAAALTAVSWRRLAAEEPIDRSRFGWRRIAPLGLAALTGIVYYRIDVWLLALVSAAGQVARYSVSYRLLDALLLPAGVLTVVTIASTARLDHSAAVRKTDRMVRVLCACLLPAVLFLQVFPAPLLRLAFGQSYAQGAPVLRILAVAVLPSVAGLLWAPLVALRCRGLLAIMVVSLMANVALNLVLIPRLGAEGSAAATLLGQTAFAALLRLRLHRLRSRTEAPSMSGTGADAASQWLRG